MKLTPFSCLAALLCVMSGQAFAAASAPAPKNSVSVVSTATRASGETGFVATGCPASSRLLYVASDNQVKCADGNYESSSGFIMPHVNAPSSGDGFWTNADIYRLSDRLFVGDTAKNSGSWNSYEDWLGQLVQAGTVHSNGNGSNAYFSTSDNPLSTQALTVAAQTAYQTSGAPTIYPLNVVAVNNATFAGPNPSPGVGSAAWGIYLEAHALTPSAEETTGMEIEGRAAVTSTIHDPFNVYQHHMVTDLQLGCGAGMPSTYNCGYAEAIFQNLSPFNTGILFTNGSIARTGVNGTTPAIAMPAGYDINWYSAANDLSGFITSTPYHNMELRPNGGSVIIASAGSVPEPKGGYILSVDGSIWSKGAAGSLSDIRHKKNVADLTEGLAQVEQLRPVTFEWKNPTDNGMQGKQTGFIAQEVQKVLPTSVMVEDNAEKTESIKYNELIPVLTKAIQQLKAEDDDLRAENEKLKARVEALEAK